MNKVFLSWSGDRSKNIASALKSWLPFVFQGLKPWMSEQDIYAGSKWGSELGQALAECKLGIICLTAESLESRWLTFEAGALSTAIAGSRVIPYRSPQHLRGFCPLAPMRAEARRRRLWRRSGVHVSMSTP